MTGQGLYPERVREARVPRWLLWALVATSVIGVTGLAFLGGYFVAVSRPAAAERGVTPASPSQEAGRSGAAAQEAPAPFRGRAGLPSSATPPAVAPAEAGGARDGNAALAAEVAAYFAATDVLMSAAKENGDPETMARKILAQAAAGDTSGLDEMIAKQRDLAARLGAVRAPAPCADHLRRSVELIERSARFLGTARDAIATGRIESLGELQAMGLELQSDARAVDALAQQIRKQYLGAASGS
jgi:hypothetical protein